jgi:monomeric sarcosine oxidase
MSTTIADAIVLGTGGVGSAAAYHLARRGCRVLGIDRFPGGHDRGSSHGQTRIIRLAYFEHPDYVPLLRRAYELWAELEQRSGEQLYHPVGLLEVGPTDGVLIPGLLKCCAKYDLPLEEFAGREFERRFPGFRVPPGSRAVFESRAGYLRVETCVLAHLAEAAKLGAQFVTGESVLAWSASADGVTVRTDANTYHAQRLVISAGPWAAQVLADLQLPLVVRRKHLHWFPRGPAHYRADQGAPCFLYETTDGYFYGFPEIDALGVKAAEHSGGTVVPDPLVDDRALEPRDLSRVQDFLAVCMPTLPRQPGTHGVCYYTLTPDENFIVDRHPGFGNVAFAAGLSGHGFKFVPVLGEILADLVTAASTAHPIEFLSLRRAALMRPGAL